jgi:chemotaxis protein MotB
MQNQTIIVKRVKKRGHGHHGGAWKVALADFVTAMMAFFLLLWLLASTTKEQRAGISEYFAPTIPGASTGFGASDSPIDLGGSQQIVQDQDSEDETAKQTAAETEAAQEKQRLESLLEELKKAIEQSQALKPFKDQLLLDITPEGLRIQIVDKENRPMFDSGSAELKPYTKQILHELAKTINTVPNRLSLTGHTDAAPFVGRLAYSNWELSADRANASRRELILGGLADAKIAKVVGLASMVPFDKGNPFSPINRRIAIIVMNRAAETALLQEENHVSSGDEARQLLDDALSEAPAAEATDAVPADAASPASAPQPAPVAGPKASRPGPHKTAAVELAPEPPPDENPDGVIPLINPIQLPPLPKQ